MKMSGSAQVEMSGFRGAMSPGSRMDGQGAGRNEQERIGVASFLERFEANIIFFDWIILFFLRSVFMFLFCSYDYFLCFFSRDKLIISLFPYFFAVFCDVHITILYTFCCFIFVYYLVNYLDKIFIYNSSNNL